MKKLLISNEWSKHVDNMTAKATNTLGLIRRDFATNSRLKMQLVAYKVLTSCDLSWIVEAEHGVISVTGTNGSSVGRRYC